jgi:hypothetical protein
MLAFGCIAIGIVCLAAVARRATKQSQTNPAFFITKKMMQVMNRQRKEARS